MDGEEFWRSSSSSSKWCSGEQAGGRAGRQAARSELQLELEPAQQ